MNSEGLRTKRGAESKLATVQRHLQIEELELEAAIQRLALHRRDDRHMPQIRVSHGSLSFQMSLDKEKHGYPDAMWLNVIHSDEKGEFQAARERLEITADDLQLGIVIAGIVNSDFDRNLEARGYTQPVGSSNRLRLPKGPVERQASS